MTWPARSSRQILNSKGGGYFGRELMDFMDSGAPRTMTFTRDQLKKPEMGIPVDLSFVSNENRVVFCIPQNSFHFSDYLKGFQSCSALYTL